MARTRPHPSNVERGREIVRDVADEHGIEVSLLLDARDHHGPRWLSRIRWQAIARLHEEMPWLSQPELGWLMGMDHSSVRHALKKMEART